MFALDAVVLDLIIGADARPTPEVLLEALGGEEVAKTRMILDPDLDLPQYESEISPTVPLRRRGERRILIIDEAGGSLRKSPRSEPIVAKDLRPERDRLVALVDLLGARLGRLNAFGSWGDAAVVTRSVRDLRAVMLLGWVLDPQTDLDGRRRATPLTQREFEEKLAIYEKRLEEVDDGTVIARVPPATLARGGAKKDLLVVDVLSDRDGSWDVRKSYELEKRITAADLFARIPGAKVTITAPSGATAASPPAPARAPAPMPEPPEPPKPIGAPISAAELDGRVVLRIPGDRFDLDGVTALGRRNLDVLQAHDQVSGRDRDRIHQHGCGFLAPLEFLSEVFLDGKPLDRKRFEAEAKPIDGGRVLEAHLPRFGPVLVLDAAGKRWVTSETAADPAALIALTR